MKATKLQLQHHANHERPKLMRSHSLQWGPGGQLTPKNTLPPILTYYFQKIHQIRASEDLAKRGSTPTTTTEED